MAKTFFHLDDRLTVAGWTEVAKRYGISYSSLMHILQNQTVLAQDVSALFDHRVAILTEYAYAYRSAVAGKIDLKGAFATILLEARFAHLPQVGIWHHNGLVAVDRSAEWLQFGKGAQVPTFVYPNGKYLQFVYAGTILDLSQTSKKLLRPAGLINSHTLYEMLGNDFPRVFQIGEIDYLCAQLLIDKNKLTVGTKNEYASSLIQYCITQHRLVELRNKMVDLRPGLRHFI